VSLIAFSQYLLKEVIYKPGLPMEPEEIVFRVLLFKLFNSIPAWEVLVQSFGTPTWAEFDQAAYTKALGDAWNEGKGVRIWNRAYVQKQNYRTDLKTKHERYLALVKYMMDDRVADRLQCPDTYEGAYRILKNYPLHGQRFLPMQHLTDINYSPVLNFDEDDFITPGDGAMRGIQKCFGRRLHAMDIQNIFCETDRYARVADPEFEVRDKEEIKQSLKPQLGPLPAAFFPRKWNINP
jgi:hypothetical protein